MTEHDASVRICCVGTAPIRLIASQLFEIQICTISVRPLEEQINTQGETRSTNRSSLRRSLTHCCRARHLFTSSLCLALEPHNKEDQLLSRRLASAML